MLDYAWIILDHVGTDQKTAGSSRRAGECSNLSFQSWLQRLEQWHGSTRQHGGHGVAEWRSVTFATWSFILQEGRFDLLESDQIYQASRPHRWFSLSFYLLHLIIFWKFLVSLFPSGISQLHRGFSQHFINKRIQQLPGSCWFSMIFHVPWGEELAQAGSEVWSMDVHGVVHVSHFGHVHVVAVACHMANMAKVKSCP